MMMPLEGAATPGSSVFSGCCHLGPAPYHTCTASTNSGPSEKYQERRGNERGSIEHSKHLLNAYYVQGTGTGPAIFIDTEKTATANLCWHLL